MRLNVNKIGIFFIAVFLLNLSSCHSSGGKCSYVDVTLDSADTCLTLDCADTCGTLVFSIADVIRKSRNETIDFSSYLSDITYIPLELSAKSILPEIKYGFCSEQYIYLCSHITISEVFIFDKHGNFVRAIRHGNGPGEIRLLKCAAYSKLTNELILLSDFSTLNYYAPDGSYKRTVQLPWSAKSFAKIDGGYIFDVQRFSFDKTANPDTQFLVRTDENFMPIWSSSEYTEFLGTHTPSIMAHSDGTVTFYIPPFNEFYGISGQQLTLRYRYDCGQYSFLYDGFKDKSEKQLMRTWEEDEKCSISSFLEIDSHIYFHFSLKGLGIHGFSDKSSLNSIGSSSIAPLIPFGFPIGTYDSQFISLVEASEVSYIVKAIKDGAEYNKDLITPETLSELEKVQADDNPVLIMYKMKHF